MDPLFPAYTEEPKEEAPPSEKLNRAPSHIAADVEKAINSIDTRGDSPIVKTSAEEVNSISYFHFPRGAATAVETWSQ
jgi:hypothetical protein